MLMGVCLNFLSVFEGEINIVIRVRTSLSKFGITLDNKGIQTEIIEKTMINSQVI